MGLWAVSRCETRPAAGRDRNPSASRGQCSVTGTFRAFTFNVRCLILFAVWSALMFILEPSTTRPDQNMRNVPGTGTNLCIEDWETLFGGVLQVDSSEPHLQTRAKKRCPARRRWLQQVSLVECRKRLVTAVCKTIAHFSKKRTHVFSSRNRAWHRRHVRHASE